MHRLALGLATLAALAGTALAHPPPPDRYIAEPAARVTLIEWTTWLRGSLAVARGDEADVVARVATPRERVDQRDTTGAAGLGLTLPLGRHARFGGWAEFRGWDRPLVGGELILIPGNLDLFQYKGKSAISLRAGGNPDFVTAQLGLGYRAPWDLFGDQPRGSRYIIGTSLVATFTQSRFDPHDWSTTVGLEFEPLGALRYILGVRSWY